MERVPLKSRAVVSAGYDSAARTLDIEFSSGRVYRFRDVPSTVYDWLLRVPNKGVYVTRTSPTRARTTALTTSKPCSRHPSQLGSTVARGCPYIPVPVPVPV
jgi:hypothetical protein